MNYQRSAERTNQKDSRNKRLPIINPQPPLQPDLCSFDLFSLDSSNSLDLKIVLSKIKSSHHSIQPQPVKAAKQSIIAHNSHTENQLSMLMQLVITTAQLQRLHQQSQSLKRQHFDSITWKQKYEDVLKRYKEGQSSFYRLTQKNKHLQNELKSYSQVPILSSTLVAKDLQIRNLKEQLRSAREPHLDMNIFQSENKRLQKQRKQLSFLLDTANIAKSKLENELSLARSNTYKFQDQASKNSREVLLTKQQLSRSNDENSKLLQTISSLKQQMIQKDRLYQQKVNIQISQYKQNADLYSNECKRLSNQNSRLNDKIILNSNNERNHAQIQAGLKQQIRLYKIDLQGLERLRIQTTTLRGELEFFRSKNSNLQSDNDQLSTTNRQHIMRIYELENRIRSLEQSRLQDSEIIMNYEFLKKQKQEQNLYNESQRQKLSNRIKQLEKHIQQLEIQQKSKDQFIQSLNTENNKLRIQVSNTNDKDLLQKHLQLSVEEMDRIHKYTKNIISQLTAKLSWLSQEKQQLTKKLKFKQFELQKLYEVLKTRKQQLQSCYQSIQSLRKDKQEKIEGQDLNQILRNRREQLF